MRHLVLAFAFCLVSSLAFANTYTIDKAHSSIDFTVKHMGISNVKGSFKDFEGKIVMDEKKPSDDSANVTIKTTSIDTGTEKRDEHLKSPDFFDTAKFPEMSFKTTKVTKTGKNFKVDGLLTLHGVEKPVSLKAEFGGEAKGPDGNERIAFSATGTLDRTQFGLTWNKPMEKVGAVMVGNDIKMEFNIEATLDKDKSAKN
jgi:polyisoprenoid-binding protein YceI